jgi:hypothetical protein
MFPLTPAAQYDKGLCWVSPKKVPITDIFDCVVLAVWQRDEGSIGASGPLGALGASGVPAAPSSPKQWMALEGSPMGGRKTTSR